jgi:hypothetical protein
MRWRALLVVLATSSVARAQVNAEALRSTLKQHPTFLWLDGALVGRAGNTETTTFSGSLFGGATDDPHLFFAKASGDYGHATGSTNVARWTIHARYNYRLSSLLALEALTQAQHDRFRRLAVRDLYGAGLRFVPYEDDELELFFGTTYVLEHEIISATEEEPLSNDIWHRSSDYLGANWQVTPIVVASTVTYVQPRFDRPADFRILHESFLSVTITKRLAARVSGSIWYDSEPPTGVKTYDLEIKNSLEVKLF